MSATVNPRAQQAPTAVRDARASRQAAEAELRRFEEEADRKDRERKEQPERERRQRTVEQARKNETAALNAHDAEIMAKLRAGGERIADRLVARVQGLDADVQDLVEVQAGFAKVAERVAKRNGQRRAEPLFRERIHVFGVSDWTLRMLPVLTRVFAWIRPTRRMPPPILD